MRVTIPTKVRSQRGASLSVVLLLFLVCATVSSIVLAAATAAAGRQSQLAEMDQRYYSVTSAQDLLWNQVEQASVTITKTVTYSKGNDGSFTVNPNNIEARIVRMNDDGTEDPVDPTNPTTPGLSCFELLASYQVFNAAVSGDPAWNTPLSLSNLENTLDWDSSTDEPEFFDVEDMGGAKPYQELVLSVSGSDGSDESIPADISQGLQCDVQITQQKNGDLRFEISNTDGDKFYRSFVAQPRIEEYDSLTRTATSSEGDTYELTRTTTVSWEPISLSQGNPDTSAEGE